MLFVIRQSPYSRQQLSKINVPSHFGCLLSRSLVSVFLAIDFHHSTLEQSSPGV
jgi:hypothetical protein